MQRIGFQRLHTFMDGPMNRPGAKDRSSIMAMFNFENDISFLFPYINAVAEHAELYENPNLIRFVFKNIHCVVYPKRCITGLFKDREDARDFRGELIDFLNDILEKKGQISPKFKVFKKSAVPDILKLLPKTNCGECGLLSCMAFAAMLSRQRAVPTDCPHLGQPLNEQITYPVYDDQGNPVSSVTFDVDSSGDRKKKPLPEEPVPYVDPALDMIVDAANASLPAGLSKREVEVLSMMAQGWTNPEISKALFISPHTVKSHVMNIFNKLGVNHRTQAVVWAVRNELI